MKYNFIDLFSGAGGLSYGFGKAGLNCLAGIDSFKQAIETFNKSDLDILLIGGKAIFRNFEYEKK